MFIFYWVTLLAAPATLGAQETPAAGDNNPYFHEKKTVKVVKMGVLARDEIARSVRRHLSAFKACYNAELSEHPHLKGKVTTAFVVTRSGRVGKHKIYSSTLNHPPTESCINKVVGKMVFPKPRGGGIVIVKYPFHFSRARPSDAPSRVRTSNPPSQTQTSNAPVNGMRWLGSGLMGVGVAVAGSGVLLAGPDGEPMGSVINGGLFTAALGAGILIADIFRN